jgi:hypothetical protein
MVAVYADNCLVVGSEEGIQDMINCRKNYDFGLKIEDNLTDYLSCKIQINQATKTTHVMQPHQIKVLLINLEKKLKIYAIMEPPACPNSRL